MLDMADGAAGPHGGHGPRLRGAPGEAKPRLVEGPVGDVRAARHAGGAKSDGPLQPLFGVLFIFFFFNFYLRKILPLFIFFLSQWKLRINKKDDEVL